MRRVLSAVAMLAPLLPALTAGCTDELRRPRVRPEPKAVKHEIVAVPGSWTMEEIDRHAGEHVAMDGRLDHRRGVYGFLITDAGVRVGIPNFDDLMSGTPWFDHVGRRIRVTGMLLGPAPSDTPTNIPGFTGPTIRMEKFQPLE